MNGIGAFEYLFERWWTCFSRIGKVPVGVSWPRRPVETGEAASSAPALKTNAFCSERLTTIRTGPSAGGNTVLEIGGGGGGSTIWTRIGGNGEGPTASAAN